MRWGQPTVPKRFFSGVTSLVKCRQVCLASVVLLLAAGLSGCGYNNPLRRKAASGKVIVDGQPLPRGSISFVSKVRQNGVRSGAVITDGEYALPIEKGLPPGEYAVSILDAGGGTAAERVKNTNMLPGSEPFVQIQQRIPPKYNFKSELIREVTAEGPNVFNFDIKTHNGNER